MKFRGQKRQTYGLIIASAVLVVLLFHFRVVQLIFDIYLLGNRPEVPTGDFGRKVEFIFFLPSVHFLMFLVLAIFNYEASSWLKTTNRTRRLVLLIIANLGLVLLFGLLSQNVFHGLFEPRGGRIRRFGLNFILYSSYPIAGIAIAEAYFLLLLERFRESELEKAQLKEERTQAMMTALKEQLSPHFFFNTLSSLSTIIRNKPKEDGLEFIQAMSSTYRYTLATQNDTVTVEQELDFFDSYSFMLKKRFGDKLVVKQDLSGETLKKRIPPMSLQILLENVIQHNVLTSEQPVKVEVFEQNDFLCVKNKLIEKSGSSGPGIGLNNLSERYKLLSGKEIFIEKTDTYFLVKLPLL